MHKGWCWVIHKPSSHTCTKPRLAHFRSMFTLLQETFGNIPLRLRTWVTLTLQILPGWVPLQIIISSAKLPRKRCSLYNNTAKLWYGMHCAMQFPVPLLLFRAKRGASVEKAAWLRCWHAERFHGTSLWVVTLCQEPIICQHGLRRNILLHLKPFLRVVPDSLHDPWKKRETKTQLLNCTKKLIKM